MKWLVTGDWQTRFSNLKECKQAHEQEVSIIKENRIEAHIDLGDLKDQYSPVDLDAVEFQFARTKNLCDIMDPKNQIKLLGNHDRTGQHSDERNWLSLFTYIGGHAIIDADIVLTKTAAVYGLPFTRNPERFLENAGYLAVKSERLQDARTKILIFHQEVNGAKFSKLQGRHADSKITLEGMRTELYHQVFGGHIHLRQKLSKNAMYVGSPFAMDWGEVDQKKGFTIYDDQTHEVSFVESWVPGRFSYAYLQKKNIRKVADGTQIKDTVMCSSVKVNYHTLLEKKIKEISKAYPNAVVQVVPKFETLEGEAEASSQSSEAEKLRLYIRASLPKELRKRKKKVQAYLQAILEKTLGRRIRSSERITFETIEATNVLSFKHVKFDFRKRGTVCVIGKNKSGGVLESNGAGKTNFLSLPCVALQGSTFKGQKHDSWANWRTKGPAIVTQTLRTSKGDRIQIERGRRPAKLQVSINGEDKSAGKTANEVQKQIEELTGYTYDTLANSVYVDQTLSNAFISGTDKSRAELLARFQNLDKYEDARAFAAEDMKKLVASEKEIEYEISLLEETAEEKKQELKLEQKETNNKRKAIHRELKAEEEKLAAAKDKAKSNIKKLEDKKKELEKEYETRYKNMQLAESEVHMQKAIVRSHEVTLKRLKKLVELKQCPECLQPFTKEGRVLLMNSVKDTLHKQEEKLKTLEEVRELATKTAKKVENAVMSLGAKLDDIAQSFEDMKETVRALRYRLEAFDENNVDEKVKQEKIQKKIDKLKSKIAASKHYARSIRKQKVIVAYAVETFNRKGFPAFLSKLICPVLNKAAEYYSNLFLDGEIAVVFEVQNDVLTPKIVNPNGDKEIAGQSTGEKAWAGLISTFATREVAQPSNLLILDEPGHGLDASGAKRFGERIRRLEKRFETILITTHNEIIQAALEGTSKVEVVKERKISRIR